LAALGDFALHLNLNAENQFAFGVVYSTLESSFQKNRLRVVAFLTFSVRN